MSAKRSKWEANYGPVQIQSFKLPRKVIAILDGVAASRGIPKTDVLIEAVLMTYTDWTPSDGP